METSTENNDSIERRCIIIKTNGDLEEAKVNLSDREAVNKIVGNVAIFKGEMEGQKIAILGAKDVEGFEKCDIGFSLTPECENLCGTVIAFLIGENGKPIDLSISHFRRSKKTLRKKQNSPEKSGNEEETKDVVEKKTDITSMEVYVEGLPYETQEEEVRNLFKDCGKIEDLRMPRYQDSGRCRGYCFVRFSSASSVQQALKKDGEHIGSRYVKISLTNIKTDAVPIKMNVIVPIDCNSIFVKNIPYDLDENAIKMEFMKFGKISNVRIPRWNDTGRQKGLCYIDFFSNQSVKQAVAQNGIMQIGGRKLVIDIETGAPKQSFRTNDGKLWKSEHKGSVKRGKKSEEGTGKKIRKEEEPSL